MTESLNDFLNLCKERTNTSSDRNLSRKVGLSHAAIGFYRRGIAFPSDDTIVTMCERAQLDPDEWLLKLNIWRAKGVTKERYMAILKKLSAVFLVSLAFIITLPAQDANASIIQALTPETAKNLSSVSINYAPIYLMLLRRVRIYLDAFVMSPFKKSEVFKCTVFNL